MGIPKKLKENEIFQELLENSAAYHFNKKTIELLNVKDILNFSETLLKNRLPVKNVNIKKSKIIISL